MCPRIRAADLLSLLSPRYILPPARRLTRITIAFFGWPKHFLSPSRCRNRRPVARTPSGGPPRRAGIAARFYWKSAPRKRLFCAFALGALQQGWKSNTTDRRGAGSRRVRPPKVTHQERTLDHQNNPDAACVARARALLAAAAIGVERLESAANLAFFRLAALTEKLARLEGLGGSGEPKAGDAAAPDAAAACRQAKALLRCVSSRQWPAGQVVVNGGRRDHSTARTISGTSSGGRR